MSYRADVATTSPNVLRRLMLGAGLTVSEFARKCGVPTPRACAWLDLGVVPRRDLRARVARVLGVRPRTIWIDLDAEARP